MRAMANGQVVLVTTEPLEGGEPLRAVYYVAEENPVKAKAIVAAVMAPNERAATLRVLPEAEIKAIGLRPGDFVRKDDRKDEVDEELDEALKGTFPASDPVSLEDPLVAGGVWRTPK